MERKDFYLKKNEKLVYTTFLPRETDANGPSYDDSLLQYEYLRAGDRRSIPESERYFRSGGFSKLSRDPVTHAKYRFVVSATLSARYAIEGGLSTDQANNIADRYIQQLDLCTSVESVLDLHTSMITDFTEHMAETLRTGQLALPLYNTDLGDEESDGVLTAAQQSRVISECVDYIYYHLHEKIYLEELARQVKLSPNYLSTLFHRKKGITMQAYIRSKRVEAASNMLLYSDYSIAKIAEILAFSSPSHFIRVFRQETGQTPKLFQEENYRKRRGAQPFHT